MIHVITHEAVAMLQWWAMAPTLSESKLCFLLGRV